MTGPRGKRRAVVEVVGKERIPGGTRDTPGYYVATVRLACGHTVKACAKNRYRKDDVPVIAYCRDPECIFGTPASRLAERGIAL